MKIRDSDPASPMGGVALACLVVLGCGRRSGPFAIGDASTTGAPLGEQRIDAPDAALPRAEAVDGGPPAPEPALPPPLPAWVPKDAALTIVRAGDRDRNLGIAPPASTAVTVDAGACEVGIEIRRTP